MILQRLFFVNFVKKYFFFKNISESVFKHNGGVLKEKNFFVKKGV